MATTTTTIVAATTTVTDRTRATARLPFRGAGLLVCAAFAISACSDDDSPSADSATPIATAVATTPPTTAPVTTTAPVPTTAPVAPPPTTLPPPDGATVLAQSLDALAPGYHFAITATRDGQVALTTEGDQIGLAARQTVTSQGITVDYIVLPEGTWKGEAGAWEELEEPLPPVDPLAVLRTPSTVAVVAHTAELTTLTATYPAAALGVPGDQPITVAFELTGTTMRSFSYTTPDGTATSRTDISPLVDTTPITSPAI